MLTGGLHWPENPGRYLGRVLLHNIDPPLLFGEPGPADVWTPEANAAPCKGKIESTAGNIVGEPVTARQQQPLHTRNTP